MGIFLKKNPPKRSKIPAVIVDMCTCSYFVYLCAFGFSTANNRELFFAVNYADRYAAFPFYCIWFYCMTIENGESTLTSFIFGNRIMQELGTLSFAIYCLHSPIFLICEC